MSKTIEISVYDLQELRNENKNLKKEKWKIRQRLVALEKNLETLSRVKENKELREENKKLKEKVRFLEECLDRKEKLNKEYRKEIDTYVYDAKQVRDIC